MVEGLFGSAPRRVRGLKRSASDRDDGKEKTGRRLAAFTRATFTGSIALGERERERLSLQIIIQRARIPRAHIHTYKYVDVPTRPPLSRSSSRVFRTPRDRDRSRFARPASSLPSPPRLAPVASLFFESCISCSSKYAESVLRDLRGLFASP